MPQLDIVSFPNQIFSVFIVFFLLFLIVSKNIIPSILKIKKVRDFSLFLSNKHFFSFSNEGSKVSNDILTSYSNSSKKTENEINVLKDSLDNNSEELHVKFNSSLNSNKKYLSSFISLIIK
jgi:hypothetical protein